MPQYLPDEVLFDKRLIERHIRAGLLSREQVEKHRQALEDMGAEADVLEVEAQAAAAAEATAVRGRHPAR